MISRLQVGALRHFSRLLVALGLTLSVFPVFTNADQATAVYQGDESEVTSSELINKVWRLSRLNQLSQTMAANVLSVVHAHPELKKLPEARRTRILSQYQQHATATRFSKRLKRHLSRASAADLHALIGLTESPVAQRALAEELAFEPTSLETMLSWRNAADQQIDLRTRDDLISRLDEALSVTDIAVVVASASMYGTSVALRDLQSEAPAQTLSDEQLNQAINAFSDRIRPLQRHQIHLTYNYLYRNLPIDNLHAYVLVLESEPIRTMQRRLIQALGSEMVAIQGDVVRGIIKQASKASPDAAQRQI